LVTSRRKRSLILIYWLQDYMAEEHWACISARRRGDEQGVGRQQPYATATGEQASCYSVSSLKYWSYTSVCNVSARESSANEQIIVNSDVKPLYFDMVVWIGCCNLWMSWDKKKLNTSHVCWVHRLASEFGKLFSCIKSESNRAWLLEYFTYLLSETGTMHGTKQSWHFDRHCFGLYASCKDIILGFRHLAKTWNKTKCISYLIVWQERHVRVNYLLQF
jgi:hypothetical protein